MPEGDTLHQAAARVGGALGGRTLTAVGGSHPAARREGRRLVGRAVTAVEAVGKHLLVHLDGGWSIRTHLGMPGSWHVYAAGERWRVTPGKARLVLEAGEVVAVCFAAPTVDIAPTDRIVGRLRHLGPDLLGDDPDLTGIVERARGSQAATLADLLLDQRVAAGIGNVYKNEVLFLERLHPGTVPNSLSDSELEAIYGRAGRLLRANADDVRRTTTGNRGRLRHWVYDRGGRPCRRCGRPIEVERHGDLSRLSWWCPRCQPPPDQDAPSPAR